MAQTIFILGTDPQQCKELREILQERIPGNVVTATSDNNLIYNLMNLDTLVWKPNLASMPIQQESLFA